jgi:uncharacterized membrane protein YfcA
MNEDSQPDFSASLTVIYFGIGFTLAAALTAVILSFVRPLIMDGPSWARFVAMLAPLLVGIPFGARVARAGKRENLRLLDAIKRALRP